jgi:hypothetical protein
MGALSDRIGRKPIMMLGCGLAVVLYLPCFQGMAGLVRGALNQTPVSVVATGQAVERTPTPQELQQGAQALDLIRIEAAVVTFADGSSALRTTTMAVPGPHAAAEARAAVPASTPLGISDTQVKLSTSRAARCWLIVCVLVVLVTMVYGPIAAFLVELFPTRIRYTSMSLPYHIGNGVFGGMVPLIATWLAGSALATPNSPLARFSGGPEFVGLLYPMSIALLTLVVGLIWLPSKATQADGQVR